MNLNKNTYYVSPWTYRLNAVYLHLIVSVLVVFGFQCCVLLIKMSKLNALKVAEYEIQNMCSGHNFLSRVLAKFTFSAITFYSVIEIGLYFRLSRMSGPMEKAAILFICTLTMR